MFVGLRLFNKEQIQYILINRTYVIDNVGNSRQLNACYITIWRNVPERRQFGQKNEKECFHDVHKWVDDVEIEQVGYFQEFQLWSEKCTKATEKNLSSLTASQALCLICNSRHLSVCTCVHHRVHDGNCALSIVPGFVTVSHWYLNHRLHDGHCALVFTVSSCRLVLEYF